MMLQPIVMNSTPASALCSTMKAFPLVLIVMAVLSVSGKATPVQVSVTVQWASSKQFPCGLQTIFSAAWTLALVHGGKESLHNSQPCASAFCHTGVRLGGTICDCSGRCVCLKWQVDLRIVSSPLCVCVCVWERTLGSVGSGTQLSLRCNISDYVLRNNYMFRPMMAIFRLSWEYLRATVSYIAELSTCLVSRCDKAQIKQNRKQITN